jgi:parallel beta-helix repeat protein
MGLTIVSDNEVHDGLGADRLDQEMIRIWPGNGAPFVVHNNVVRRSFKGRHTHDGIRVRQCGNCTLTHNEVSGTDRGISIERGSRVTLRGNSSGGNRRGSLHRDGNTILIDQGNAWMN